jgi:hypothetical protein
LVSFFSNSHGDRFALESLHQIGIGTTLSVAMTQLTFVPATPAVHLALRRYHNHMVTTHANLIRQNKKKKKKSLNSVTKQNLLLLGNVLTP